MKAYGHTLVEVLTFSEGEQSEAIEWLVGFFWLDEETRKIKLSALNKLLQSNSNESLLTLPKILKEHISFLIFVHNKQAHVARLDKLEEIFSEESYLSELTVKLLYYLREDGSKSKLQSILDKNLEAFLTYEVKRLEAETKQKETPKVFKKLVNFDKAEKREVENLEELESYGFEPTEEPLSSCLYDIISETKENWELYFLRGDQFPLFELNTNSLYMQQVLLGYCSEFSRSEQVVIKSWELYRKHQDFLDFLSHTTTCQSLLRRIYNDHAKDTDY